MWGGGGVCVCWDRAGVRRNDQDDAAEAYSSQKVRQL